MTYQVITKALGIGDEVLYRGAWGRGPGTECKITSTGTKNGERVYGNSLNRWGYAYQYTLVGEAGS